MPHTIIKCKDATRGFVRGISSFDKVEFPLLNKNDLTWCIVVTDLFPQMKNIGEFGRVMHMEERPMIHFKLSLILTFHSAKFQLVYSMFSPIIQIEVTIY
jgi:hypothetical protein